ncbi:MAG TPA: iron-containing redox enzyme family protein, partial [Dehalococcoidia bacterium]|nr:iron-containing redox enzyme family protein [Dehalococcoidia bacterium]
MDGRERLLSFYELFPFERHPLWEGVLKGELPLDAILRAEVQHYLRTREGQPLRLAALQSVRTSSPRIFKVLLETYLEECIGEGLHPSHLVLIERLLLGGGIPVSALADAPPTLGNALAIAMYRDISRRGAGCHMLGAGAVEFYYSQLAPKIFRAYTQIYGMSAEQAETYAIHGPMDREHADRAFRVLQEAVALHGWSAIEASARDAFAATSLHYDGMLEAA